MQLTLRFPTAHARQGVNKQYATDGSVADIKLTYLLDASGAGERFVYSFIVYSVPTSVRSFFTARHSSIANATN